MPLPPPPHSPEDGIKAAMQSSLWLNSLSEKEKDNSDSQGQQPLHASFNLDARETLITQSVCDKNSV